MNTFFTEHNKKEKSDECKDMKRISIPPEQKVYNINAIKE